MLGFNSPNAEAKPVKKLVIGVASTGVITVTGMVTQRLTLSIRQPTPTMPAPAYGYYAPYPYYAPYYRPYYEPY